jgi:AcrR family transcriptional regulator
MPRVLPNTLPVLRDKQTARRRDVAQAAIAVIARDGLDSMSLRAIASEMRCSTGVLTHYFRDKAALIKFILDVMLEELSEQLASVEADRTPSSLAAFILSLLPNDAETQMRWRVFLAFTAASTTESALRQDQERRESVLHDWLVGIIRRMIADGQLAPDVDAELEAQSLLCFIDGLGMHTLVAPGLYTRPRQQQLIERYVRNLTPAG